MVAWGKLCRAVGPETGTVEGCGAACQGQRSPCLPPLVYCCTEHMVCVLLVPGSALQQTWKVELHDARLGDHAEQLFKQSF